MRTWVFREWTKILSTVALLFAGDVGDYLEQLPSVVACPLFRAFLDTWIHSWIGVLSWSIVDTIPWDLNLELASVALGAAFIDLDHFLAAGTLDPHKAIHAPHRGIFHCTGLMSVVSAALYPVRPHWSLLLLVAFIPHHVRDGVRRGIYLCPPDMHTPPIPKAIARIFLPVFPWVMYYMKRYFVNKLEFGLPSIESYTKV